MNREKVDLGNADIGLRRENAKMTFRSLCARTKNLNSRLFLSSEKKAIGICLLQAGGKYQRRTHQVGGVCQRTLSHVRGCKPRLPVRHDGIFCCSQGVRRVWLVR